MLAIIWQELIQGVTHKIKKPDAVKLNGIELHLAVFPLITPTPCVIVGPEFKATTN